MDFLTSFKLLVTEFEVSCKGMLHRVCPLALGVSEEVLMDSTNFVPSSKINEQRECSHNVETLILFRRYRVVEMRTRKLIKFN